MTVQITLEHACGVMKAINKANTADLCDRPMSAQKATSPTDNETLSMHTPTPPDLWDAVKLGPIFPEADTTATQSTPTQMNTPAQGTCAAAGGPVAGDGSPGGDPDGNGNGGTTGGSGALGEECRDVLTVIIHRDLTPLKIHLKKSEKSGIQKVNLRVQNLIYSRRCISPPRSLLADDF